MSAKNEDLVQNKIHPGFRLTKKNYKLLEELENEYGENVNRYLMRYTGKNTLIIK